MRLKPQESMKIKSKTSSETEAKINDQPSLASDTFALLEKNHKAAEGAGPEEHFEIEKNNFALLEELLAHYIQHQKEGTFPKNKNATDVEDKENPQGENLNDMIQDLKKVIKNGENTLKDMIEQIAKNKKYLSEAKKQNIDREVAIQKIHEQDNEVRQKFTDIEAEEAFEKYAGDGQKIEGLPEMKKQFSNIKNKFSNRNKTDTENSNKTVTEFVQKGDTNTQTGAGVAKACTAGFFSVLPPSFAYKKYADWGRSSFYASGYHRQGALYYKNCKSGYRNVLGVCWADCNGGYRDFGATCTRCYWGTCGSGWFKFSCPKCHTYGKHSYGTHIITLFDYRVKCHGGNGYYKFGALCYRNCGDQNDGLINCGIGACAMSTESCVAGVLTMIAELLIGMATFVAFVASFGTSSAGAGQMTAGAARALLRKAGSKAKYAFKFAQKIARSGAFRETLKKNAVKAAKKKIQRRYWKVR